MKSKSFLSIVILFMILSVTVGFAAFGSELSISKIVAEIQMEADIRITDIAVESYSDGVSLGNSNYSIDSIVTNFTFPNSSSEVVYRFTVTNIGNAEMGILNVSGCSSGLSCEFTEGYEVKNKICDDSGMCNLGISKDLYLKISGGTSTETIYNESIKFDFQPFRTITYSGISGSYQTEIINGDTLTVDFSSNAPKGVGVYSNGAMIKDYTYDNGVLVVPNVSGNLTIKNEVKVLLTTYLSNLYTPDSTVVNNEITYNVDTDNYLINDRLGGQTTDLNAGNIRYYGANPNNYIDIGDVDDNGDAVLWRIIGLFKDVTVVLDDGTTETRDLVKLVRKDSIGEFSYDGSTAIVKPMWFAVAAPWSGAYFNTFMNSGAYFSSLDNNTLNKVLKVRWDVLATEFVGLSLAEWNSTSSDDWDGRFGLISPSDYGYAVDFSKCSAPGFSYQMTDSSYGECSNNVWLNDNKGKWILVEICNPVVEFYYITSEGGISTGNGSENVYPTFYLADDLYIAIGDTGAQSDPYVIVE